jgi:O-antigen ligase
MAIFAGVISQEAVVERIQQGTEGTEALTILNRVNEDWDAWQAFRERPILGQGLGYQTNTPYVYATTIQVNAAYFTNDFYLYVLCKFGLLGVIVFGGFIVAMVRTCWQGYKRVQEPFAKGVIGSTAALLIALLVESITMNTYASRSAPGILAIIMGVVLVLRNQNGLDNARVSPRRKAVYASA